MRTKLLCENTVLPTSIHAYVVGTVRVWMNYNLFSYLQKRAFEINLKCPFPLIQLPKKFLGKHDSTPH